MAPGVGMRKAWFAAIELHVLLHASGASRFLGEPVLAPGPAALAAARARGLKTVVVVSDRSYYGEQFDGLVDSWIVTDSRDPVAVARALSALDGRVAAIHSFVDTFVGTAAAANRLLGLRGADPLAPALARNKAVARQALMKSGAESVAFHSVRLGVDPLKSLIGYPCIAKPVDGAASWDVRLLRSDED
jgi:biotin carboxylase